MKGLLGWAMAIGGGYLVLKYLGHDPLAMIEGSVGSTTTTSPQGNDASTTQNNSNASVSNATLAAMVAQMKVDKVDPNGLYSIDGWNYYYKSVRGVSGPSPEDLFPGVDRNRNYSIQEYWAGMTGKGFSGLGTIAMRVNPYTNPYGNPFGSNIMPTGIESVVIRKGY